MYEDYMQNILGYRMNPQANMNTYEQYNMQGEEWQQYDNYMPMMQPGGQMVSNMNIDLESCYPEIYKIVYPMIRNVCMRNTEPITEEVIDRMVNEVYTNIETGDVITLNINLGNSVTTGEKSANTEAKEGTQNRETESRQRNFLMNDLIRILLIRELLRRQGGNRPPFPPRPFPPRPFPPRPPMNRPPMNRPPIMPRYDEYPNY